jgi:hypothetical protein
MHVYLANPNGFGDCFESVQIFNVPNYWMILDFSYCQNGVLTNH